MDARRRFDLAAVPDRIEYLSDCRTNALPIVPAENLQDTLSECHCRGFAAWNVDAECFRSAPYRIPDVDLRKDSESSVVILAVWAAVADVT